jgi:hypothetical protein
MRVNHTWAVVLSLVVLSTLAFGQNGEPDPVTVTLESYLVSVETGSDGSVVERFAEAVSAYPGQIIEYRVIAIVGAEAGLPAATLALVGPIPDGTEYLLDTATPSSDDVTLEASLDGVAFAVPPLVVTVTDADGRDVEVEADASAYRAVRWLVTRDLVAGDRVELVYRVVIRGAAVRDP